MGRIGIRAGLDSTGQWTARVSKVCLTCTLLCFEHREDQGYAKERAPPAELLSRGHRKKATQSYRDRKKRWCKRGSCFLGNLADGWHKYRIRLQRLSATCETVQFLLHLSEVGFLHLSTSSNLKRKKYFVVTLPFFISNFDHLFRCVLATCISSYVTCDFSFFYFFVEVWELRM